MKIKSNIVLLLSLVVGACTTRQESASETLVVNRLDSPAGPESSVPYLFTDNDSVVYLSWVEKKSDTATMKYAKLENEKWLDATTIATGNTWFVNWADYPMMSRNGETLLAHYLDRSSDGRFTYDVRYVMATDGVWSAPKTLHDDGKAAEHGFVTMLPYGNNFFVSWLDGRNAAMEGMEGSDHSGHHGSMTVRAAVVDPLGNKINEWELDNKTCDCCQTTAAITDNGPVVVYRDRSDAEIRDMSIARFVDGNWTEPKPIHNDNWKIEGCPVNGPRMEAIGNTVAIAWFTAANSAPRVNVVFSNDGGASFSTPVQIDEGDPIGRVDLVLLDDQTAVVSWMEGADIRARKVHNNGTKENSITIATSSNARSSGFPQMTKAGNRLVFAWTDDQEKRIKVASINL